MEMKPLISIIIPVYNVELYLRRCLDSVVKQTYSNVEIIIVNDGSTDNSLVICEEYYTKYPNLIHIINKTNGGLSSARNIGLEYSNGDYICFIDSDDYVDEKYIEILFRNMHQMNADVSCCNYKRTYKSIENRYYSDKIILKTDDDIIEIYLTHEMTSAWGKLYRKNLFQNIKFPVNKVYEDILTNFKILINCSRIVIDESMLYMYYVRRGSITTSKFREKNLHLLDAWNEVLNITAEKYNQNIYNKAKYRRDRVYFTLLAVIARYGFDSNISKKRKNEIINFLKLNFNAIFKEIFFSKLTPLNRKIIMLCFRVNYCACFYFGKILRRLF